MIVNVDFAMLITGMYRVTTTDIFKGYSISPISHFSSLSFVIEHLKYDYNLLLLIFGNLFNAVEKNYFLSILF